jgi:tetratricopeptide (TPR) repeat protein
MTFRRGLLAASVCAATTAAFAGVASGNATTRPGFDDSVRQLASADPRARDTAAAALRDAGRSAESTLRAAAESKDPELARRARGLLAGITRHAPDDIEESDPPDLERYRTADHGSKLPLVDQVGRSGGAGYRAGLLVRLWTTEDDDELRAVLFSTMLREPSAAASALVARGERPAARRLLEIALAQGNVGQAAESYVALCLLDDDLSAEITRWSAPRQRASGDSTDVDPRSDVDANADLIAARVLCQLRRAAGDARGAVAAARRAGDASLYEEALLDAGDWSAYAGALEARPQQVAQPRQLGMIAGALQLAGDARGFDDVIARMRKLATPETIDDVAHILLLCGRVDEGLKLLTDAGPGGSHDVERFKLLAAREEFDAAWKLVQSRDAAHDEPAMQLRLAAAEQRQSLGDHAAAEKMLSRVVEENRAANVPEIYAGLGDLCRAMGRGDDAWNHYRDAFRALGGGGGAGPDGGRESAIARRAFDLSDGDDDGDGVDDLRGDELWQLLAWRMRDNTVDERFARARAIVDGKIPLDELVKLADFSGRHAGNDGARIRERAFGDAINVLHFSLVVAQRMKAADGEVRAAQYLTDIVDRLPTPELATDLLIRPGDWAADRGDFLKAAEWYGRAWNLDRTRSAALYLRAWALGKAGWTRRAAELTDLALAVPLGDVYRRYESVRLLHRRGMTAALSREADVIRRTARGDSYPADLAVQIAADDALRDDDALAAAALHERSLLNRMGAYELSEPSAHLRLPHNLHRERARGLLAKGDVDAAEREIATCRALLPGDVMLPIEVVPALEHLGKKARADELYDESKKATEAVLAEYPNSANDHNNLAWLAVNCGRDADLALSHARRACELKRKNAAYLDTLAEVQFRRGEYDDAIKTMKRCVELQPNERRHREQIERFEAGKHGEQRPMPQG